MIFHDDVDPVTVSITFRSLPSAGDVFAQFERFLSDERYEFLIPRGSREHTYIVNCATRDEASKLLMWLQPFQESVSGMEISSRL